MPHSRSRRYSTRAIPLSDPAQPSGSRLSLVADRQQFDVVQPETDDCVVCPLAGMLAAGTYLESQRAKALAGDIQIAHGDDEVVEARNHAGYPLSFGKNSYICNRQYCAKPSLR